MREISQINIKRRCFVFTQSADHLTFAYKYGSFVKIKEFVDLKEKLENSLHFAMTTVDKMLLELSWCDSPTMLSNTLQNMRVRPQEDTIRWELLQDNRDLEVVVGWEPLDKTNGDPRMREETRSCMLRLLASRGIVLRILAATAEPDSSSALSTLATELKQHHSEHVPRCLEKFQEPESGKSKAESVLVPLDAVERLREAHDSQQLITIANLADSLARSSKPDEDCVEFLKKSPALLCPELPDSDCPVSYRQFFLRATTCGETLAYLSAMCVSYSTTMQPRAINKKKNKKCKDIVSLTTDECKVSRASEGFMARTFSS